MSSPLFIITSLRHADIHQQQTVTSKIKCIIMNTSNYLQTLNSQEMCEVKAWLCENWIQSPLASKMERTFYVSLESKWIIRFWCWVSFTRQGLASCILNTQHSNKAFWTAADLWEKWSLEESKEKSKKPLSHRDSERFLSNVHKTLGARSLFVVAEYI